MFQDCRGIRKYSYMTLGCDVSDLYILDFSHVSKHAEDDKTGPQACPERGEYYD